MDRLAFPTAILPPVVWPAQVLRDNCWEDASLTDTNDFQLLIVIEPFFPYIFSLAIFHF